MLYPGIKRMLWWGAVKLSIVILMLLGTIFLENISNLVWVLFFIVYIVVSIFFYSAFFSFLRRLRQGLL